MAMKVTVALDGAAAMPADTLVSLMEGDAVSNDELYARYGAAATIAKHMLGVIPNSNSYFEIWPPASRICFTIVPNFLNAPFLLFGLGAPKNLISLAMFASSIGADCPYCISHCCTFSMRRGVQIDKLTLDAIALRHEADSKFSALERAVIDVAESIGQVPCTLTHTMKQTLVDQLKDPGTTEWIVVAVGMMGFLNKSMDALGIPLEVDCYQETRDILGEKWSPRSNGQLVDPETQPPVPSPSPDSLWTYLAMMWQGPGAAAFERKALAGVPPGNWAESSAFLETHTGYAFPLLQHLQHTRVVRAITGVLRESLHGETSVVGMQSKVLMAQIFTTIAQSKPLQEMVDALAIHFQVTPSDLAKAVQFATESSDPFAAVETLYASPEEDNQSQLQLQTLLLVAHGASWSPVRIDEQLVARCRDMRVPSAALVEAVTWVAVLQMLHRLSMFYFF